MKVCIESEAYKQQFCLIRALKIKRTKATVSITSNDRFTIVELSSTNSNVNWVSNSRHA